MPNEKKSTMFRSTRIFPFLFGLAMTLNFAIIWALPVMGMGALWKSCFKSLLLPLFNAIDESEVVRSFAKDYVYTKPEHSDFFLVSVLVTLNSFISFGIVIYYQLSAGTLPLWLIFVYYCSWVGIGGRTMGGAYALAHKEVSQDYSTSVTTIL
jgi:hypothetical protein